MGNLTVATIFIVCLNVLMWFSQLSMLAINPVGTFCYNVEGSIIGNSITGTGNFSVLNNQVVGDLPEAQTQIQPGSTSFSFTDVFSSILGWFKTAPGLKYVYGVVAAPYNILKCMGLPNEFVVGIGTLWYLVTLLVLVGYMVGREQ